MLHTPKAYSAFVRSLEHCAAEAEYERLDDKYYDEFYLRDMAEKICLLFILQLLNKYSNKELIKAKFIEKWLVKQNWGDTVEERQQNFLDYMKHKQNRITDICQRLQDSKYGRDALKASKLLPETRRDDPGDGGKGLSVVFSLTLEDENQDGRDEDRRGEPLQPRILEQSAEERRLRRQHREAIVMNDGSRPFGRDDIIERDRE